MPPPPKSNQKSSKKNKQRVQENSTTQPIQTNSDTESTQNTKKDTEITPKLDFVQRLEANPWKVSKWNAVDLKHSLDDGIRSVCFQNFHLELTRGQILLEDYSMEENHTHLNRKLLFGYTAVFIAAVATLYSLRHPIQEIRWSLFVLVALFFVFQGALMAYTQYVEGETILVAVQRDPLGLVCVRRWT
jgi:hypothetical protein